MIKLNIQRFGHTNSTQYYELPQFVGTDKPQWLTDINQGFLAIDTAIHSAYALASLTSTNVGDLTDLTTTVKTDLVSSINEVNGGLGDLSSIVAGHTTAIGNNTTAIGNLVDLDTVDKASLVNAVNEVDLIANNNSVSIGTLTDLSTNDKTSLVNAVNEVNYNVGLFNLTHFENFSTSNVTAVGCTCNSCEITVASNEDGSLAKVYGQIGFRDINNNYSGGANAYIQTRLRPASDIVINGGLLISIRPQERIVMTTFTIKTDGKIYFNNIRWFYSASDTEVYNLMNSLLFIKDFGDSPTPVNP